MLFKRIAFDSMTTGRFLTQPFFVENVQVSYYILKQEKWSSGGFSSVHKEPEN